MNRKTRLRPMILAGLLTALSVSACARLGPAVGHEAAGPQVTMDSLRTAVRDNQRLAADLRIELADRRKELADVHVARAQLEGLLREAERRLADARQIIELQREELDAARVDRERSETSDRQLQSRLRRLEKLLAQARRQGQTAEIIPSGYAPSLTDEKPRPIHAAPGGSAVVAAHVMTGEMFPPETDLPAITDVPSKSKRPRVIVVREGETLWRLAKRHHVDLEELKQLNGLQDNRIVRGTRLRLPASVQGTGRHAADSRRIMR
ncbi:MAG TPA: LysM peptidoglycan-binding domain-containing protein [Nitrospiraceae bacterium]|nr:LysM peptidoglycan-binding domain-containing protein [Nitrospiraceae bacterium]